jgi:restriction system protein
VPIPDFQSIMRPLLAVLADGQDETVQTIRDTLARQFELTDEELEQRLPSGRDRTYRNRVGWALTHLKGAVVIESPRRGVYRITERGRQLLAETPGTERVDLRLLSAFEEYRQFRSQEVGANDGPSPDTAIARPDATSVGTPTERIEAASRELRAALAADVLDRIREQSPEFFEQVVLDVLQAIGYGGSREDSAERLGRSGDGGVDGVIREDRLGLDLIYVQAKRWANTVGRPDIQQFVGALNGQRAHSIGVRGPPATRAPATTPRGSARGNARRVARPVSISRRHTGRADIPPRRLGPTVSRAAARGAGRRVALQSLPSRDARSVVAGGSAVDRRLPAALRRPRD